MDTPLQIVTIDIENMPNLLWSWQTYGQNWSSIETVLDWHMICFAAKWYGKKTKIFSLEQYQDYKPMMQVVGDTIIFIKPDERQLLQEIWNILDQADIVVGWNSKRFDIKKIQSKLLAYGFPPPSPFRQIDVMVEKKKVAASNSNKLDLTGEEWGLGRKLPHHGFPLWRGCAQGDAKSWSKMRQYNIQDVILTEDTYTYLRPWIANHPNLAVMKTVPTCPKCLSRDVQKRGSETRTSGVVQRWYCHSCKGNSYTNIKEKLPLKSS